MAAKGTEPEKPVEIEDADAWNAVVSKGNKDLEFCTGVTVASSPPLLSLLGRSARRI